MCLNILNIKQMVDSETMQGCFYSDILYDNLPSIQEKWKISTNTITPQNFILFFFYFCACIPFDRARQGFYTYHGILTNMILNFS